jgi:hypothetical protein
LALLPACLPSVHGWVAGEETAPTPTTLAKWLEDKEVVEVRFVGPYLEPLKLRDSMKTKVSDTDRDFRLTAGEGGGTNGSFIEISMKATPENIRRLLAVQEELSPRSYLLDSKAARVWSYHGDADTRAKARALIPEFWTAVERGIKEGVPMLESSSQRNELRYKVPGTNVRGMIRVSEITADKSWEDAAEPEQTVHLPRLGLRIVLHYRPAEIGARKDASAERKTIRKVFGEAVQPLLKLEPGAAVKERSRSHPK